MSLEGVECKDNNAAFVKRIMPKPFCYSQQERARIRIYNPLNNSRKSQKNLTLLWKRA